MSANETEFTITGDVKWVAINSSFKDKSPIYSMLSTAQIFLDTTYIHEILRFFGYFQYIVGEWYLVFCMDIPMYCLLRKMIRPFQANWTIKYIIHLNHIWYWAVSLVPNLHYLRIAQYAYTISPRRPSKWTLQTVEIRALGEWLHPLFLTFLSITLQAAAKIMPPPAPVKA